MTIVGARQKYEISSAANSNIKKKNNKNKKKGQQEEEHEQKCDKKMCGRMVTSYGMTRTSHCALHLRARTGDMNTTNAHTTIHSPGGISLAGTLQKAETVVNHFAFSTRDAQNTVNTNVFERKTEKKEKTANYSTPCGLLAKGWKARNTVNDSSVLATFGR